MTQKIDLRKYYRTLRKQISSERREAAAKLLLIYLLNKNFSHILSFASCGTELDLALVNQYYASQGCLLLPKIDGYQLEIYQVQDIGFDLVSSSAGPPEPNDATCLKVDISCIDLILVPGLVFDLNGYRLGYGKGHYDRLLARMPHVHTIGVGFAEQRYTALLPRDPWDIPICELLLV